MESNYPATGSDHDGTEAFILTTSRALGTSNVRVGRPNSSGGGPIGSPNVAAGRRPLYGLSDVLTVVAANAAGAPTISGTAQVGNTLTADISTITDPDGLTGPGYTYQWIRVDADGVSNPTNVGSNSSTYTLVAGDAGKKSR